MIMHGQPENKTECLGQQITMWDFKFRAVQVRRMCKLVKKHL